MAKIYTVIGDLVGSRQAPDRAALQRDLDAALTEVNSSLRPEQQFQPTVGDEYQGGCRTLAEAVLGALLVRLHLHGSADCRAGIGFGEVVVHDASRAPLLQDGPGWWAARAAVEEISGARDPRRTWYAGPGAGTLNAYLTCRDQLVDRLSDRGPRMLRLALLGRTQREIAAAEGIWPSAVSQQFSRGITALLQAQALLAEDEVGP